MADYLNEKMADSRHPKPRPRSPCMASHAPDQARGPAWHRAARGFPNPAGRL